MVGLVAAHGDAFELFEFAEEVLDQVAPSINFGVDCAWRNAARMLGDDDPAPSRVQFGENPIGIEGLVAEQGVEFDPVNERGNADRIEPVTR